MARSSPGAGVAPIGADEVVGVALGALGFTRAASANLREKDDPWNAAISGAVGGAIAGLSRTWPPSPTHSPPISRGAVLRAPAHQFIA